MQKIIIPDEQAEQIVKALVESGEVKIGTSKTSLVTLKTTYYETTLSNPDGKYSKKKAVKLQATKGRIFKDKF